MERRTEWFVEMGEPSAAAETAPADGAGVPRSGTRKAAPARTTPGGREKPVVLEKPAVVEKPAVLEIDAADDDLDQIVRDLDR
jgi:hypothetical protein